MHERITFTFDSLAFLCVSAKILPEFWQDAKLIFAGTMHLIDPIYTLNQCALRTYNTRREQTQVQFPCYFFFDLRILEIKPCGLGSRIRDMKADNW